MEDALSKLVIGGALGGIVMIVILMSEILAKGSRWAQKRFGVFRKIVELANRRIF
jgi:hypothetical protein